MFQMFSSKAKKSIRLISFALAILENKFFSGLFLLVEIQIPLTKFDSIPFRPQRRKPFQSRGLPEGRLSPFARRGSSIAVGNRSIVSFQTTFENKISRP